MLLILFDVLVHDFLAAEADKLKRQRWLGQLADQDFETALVTVGTGRALLR